AVYVIAGVPTDCDVSINTTGIENFKGGPPKSDVAQITLSGKCEVLHATDVCLAIILLGNRDNRILNAAIVEFELRERACFVSFKGEIDCRVVALNAIRKRHVDSLFSGAALNAERCGQ